MRLPAAPRRVRAVDRSVRPGRGLRGVTGAGAAGLLGRGGLIRTASGGGGQLLVVESVVVTHPTRLGPAQAPITQSDLVPLATFGLINRSVGSGLRGGRGRPGRTRLSGNPTRTTANRSDTPGRCRSEPHDRHPPPIIRAAVTGRPTGPWIHGRCPTGGRTPRPRRDRPEAMHQDSGSESPPGPGRAATAVARRRWPDARSTRAVRTHRRPAGPRTAGADPGAHRLRRRRQPPPALAREQLLRSLETRPIATFDLDQMLRLPVPPADDVLHRGPLERLRRAAAGACTCCTTTPRRPSCCSAGPSRTCSGNASSPPSTALDQPPRRPAHRRPQRDPDGGAAHPPGRGHRARHPARADRRPRAVAAAGAGARPASGTCSSSASASRVATRSASPRTCRTTWRRPSTRPPPRCCSPRSPRSTGLMLPTETLRDGGRGDAGRRSTGRSPSPTRPPPWCRPWRSSTTRSCAAVPSRTCWPTRAGPLPTADELGAELERFLAEQSPPPGDTPAG